MGILTVKGVMGMGILTVKLVICHLVPAFPLGHLFGRCNIFDRV